MLNHFTVLRVSLKHGEQAIHFGVLFVTVVVLVTAITIVVVVIIVISIVGQSLQTT